MSVGRGWLWLCLLGAGCQSFSPGEAVGQAGDARSLPAPGREAVGLSGASALADRDVARGHLSLAAALLEKGDEAGAEPHLARYLAAFPEHHVVRAHRAELLLRLDRPREAAAEFERFIADVQDVPELAAKHLIHCHSRLMEIAEAEGDPYGEHLNRGIGLYLLGRERARLPDPEGLLSAESVLCRAAGELTMARLERRGEARPSWYLHEVWTQLAQRQPALRHLREADRAAPFTYLTPAEKRHLRLACLGREDGLPPK